ncbi:MAG: tetratricopeptide repeat protein [Planctomycetota bacterium]|jgi:thioredoxin-like negative regulator of GroEL|nr:tetratricopeptide repeat protein [Planctomycetota bacterium]
MDNMMAWLLGRKKGPIEHAIDEALSLLEEKDYDAAIAVIQNKALTREPENRRAILHLGICYMLKGELDQAETILRTVVRKGGMDSESAAALIALEKIGKDRGKAK